MELLRRGGIVAIALGICLASMAEAQPLRGKRRALIVGINDYQHGGLRDLKYAENDVLALQPLLERQGYEVALLTSSSKDRQSLASKTNIERQLKTLLQNCGQYDTALVVFSGHGLQFDGQRDAYFCPLDARPFADETASLISLGEVYRELEKSFAGMKVLLVDACRNDPQAARGARGIDADNSPRPPQGVAALFSCRAGEQAFEHDSLKHGVFFHYVLQGLRGEARDLQGTVTFAGLASYVSRRVPKDVVERIGGGAQQSPNLKADYSTEPILAQIAAGDVAAKLAPAVAPLPPGVREPLPPAAVLPPLQAYSLDLTKVVEGGFPKGWKVDQALGVQPTSSGRMLTMNGAGQANAELPDAVLHGDFYLESEIYIGGWNAGMTVTLRGQGESPTFKLAAFHGGGNTPCTVRVNESDGHAMASAAEFRKWLHTVRLESRGGIIKVFINGNSLQSVRLPASSTFQGIEFVFNSTANHYAAEHHTALRRLSYGPLVSAR